MTSLLSSKRLLAFTIILTALVSCGVTYLITKPAGPGAQSPETANTAVPDSADNSGNQEREILYWRAPMDPMEIYDEPGKSKMGMDLVPVYKDEMEAGPGDQEREIVYWRAPMDPTEIYDAPGKSKMGMDLVPVYEDELVGGVDVKIDPVVRQNMGLKTAPVAETDLSSTIETYGHVTYDDTRTFAVSAKTGGWIETLFADYTGVFVEKGQPLYEIYSPDLVAAQEAYVASFKHFTRSKSPLNSQILATAEKRLSYFDVGKEEILKLQASGTVEKRMIIRSPYTGVVIKKDVLEGAYVKPGASLFTVSDLSRVWVEAHIFEYEQARVRPGQTAVMTLDYAPGTRLTGTIDYVFPYLQPKTRDVVVRMVFDNPSLALKPDMFAKVAIHTGQGTRGLTIPAEAVIHAGNKNIVFISKAGGKFSPRTVTTGAVLDNGRLEVVTGLTKADTVVVSGQFLLDSESKLKEAIQKMMEDPNPPASEGVDFFEDMDTPDKSGSDDDFFKDMEIGGQANDRPHN